VRKSKGAGQRAGSGCPIFLSPGERSAGPPAIAGALSDPLMPFSFSAGGFDADSKEATLYPCSGPPGEIYLGRLTATTSGSFSAADAAILCTGHASHCRARFRRSSRYGREAGGYRALLSPAITILAISTHEINRPPRRKHRWGSDTSVMAPIPPTLLGGSREMNAAGDDVGRSRGLTGGFAGVVALATGMRRGRAGFEPRHIRGGAGRSPPAHAIAEARRHVGRAAGRPKIRTP
jgi:hypothetical protein